MEMMQTSRKFLPNTMQHILPDEVSSFRPTVRGGPNTFEARIAQTPHFVSTKGFQSSIRPDKAPSSKSVVSGVSDYDDEELELEEIFVGNIRQSTYSNGEQIDVITLEDSSDDLSALFDDDDDGVAETGFRSAATRDALSPLQRSIEPVQFTSSRPGVTVSPVPSHIRDPNDSISRAQASPMRFDRSPSCSPHPGDQQRFKPFHEEKWNLRLSELKQYRKEHGSCLVPHTYPKHPQLARWVKRQRRQHKLFKSGRASTMTPERLQLLEEIGFVWDSHEACWQEKLQELRDFKAKVGNCLVPSNYKKNPQLATWVKCQRRQHKLYWLGRSSAMTPERIVELEKIGFEWELRSNTTNVDRSDYLMLSQAIRNL